MLQLLFMLPWLVLLSAQTNPSNILISEIMVKDRFSVGKSMFLEIARYSDDDEIVLDGYSVLVATTSTDRNLKTLQVLCAIDLSGTKMKPNQRYGVIGRSAQEAEANDIVPFAPSSKFQLINRQLTSKNWLTVDFNKHLVVFLLYSENKKIFDDVNVWDFGIGAPNKKKMSPGLENYALSNFVDILFINGISAPSTCNVLHKMFNNYLPEVISVMTTSTAPEDLSISRCGKEFKKCLFHNYKSSLPTPGMFNINYQISIKALLGKRVRI